VARELPEGNSEVAGEFSEGVRVNTLRKMLGERFGAKVWGGHCGMLHTKASSASKSSSGTFAALAPSDEHYGMAIC